MTDPTQSRDRMPSADEESGSPIDAGTDERLQEEPGQAGPETPGAPNELSLHFNEGSWRNDRHRVRRYTIRLDGFVSAHAPYSGGEIVTKPLTFTGKALSLNYATSAAGSVKIELQDAAGNPLPGFALADAEELFGDSVDQTVSWTGGADVSSLAGKTVRLRFVLKDADVYSYQFGE